MGSLYIPEVRLEIGLSGPYVGADVLHIGDAVRGQVGVAAIGAADLWSDITEYVRSWSFRRGSARGDGPNLRYEAGTFSAVLNNGDRALDPTNTAGPFASGGVSLLTAMVRVRITATWDGVAYRLWTGFADAWTPDYNSPSWSTVTLTATDAFKVFASIERKAVAAVGGGENSGSRINRILTGLSWPVDDRAVQLGDSTLQATTLDGVPLTEMFLVTDSELGELYMDAEGNVVYRNRHALLDEARSNTPQATFGDDTSSTTYSFDDFESGIGAWVGTGGTATASAVQAHAGTQSALTTVTGTPTIVYTRKAQVPVVVGHRYRLGFWAYAPVGVSVSASIDWADPSIYLSTSSTTYDVDGGVWTFLETTGTAPSTATQAGYGPTIFVVAPETIPAGLQLFVDEVEFADLDSEIPYRTAQVQNDDTTMANKVTTQIVGGVEQIVEDTLSQSRYLLKTYQRTDLLLTTDDEALQYGEWVLYQGKDPELRFSEVEFGVPELGLNSIVWPSLLARELGDRVTVIRRPPGGGDPNYRDVFIRGIEVSSDGANWTTRFQLQSATKYQFFTVGSASLGRVGYNAIAF